ncbi:MAG: hypothetical protein JNL10_08155 [Verrucomicrobiales bacterium]|nr:hypothetical protein [Verrucomicrobiales bacterium]
MPTPSAMTQPGARPAVPESLSARFQAGFRRPHPTGADSFTRATGSPRLHLSLILLPVAALALGGMAALSSDRAAVESDARQRSDEVIQRVAAHLARTVPGELALLKVASDHWAGADIDGTESASWTPASRAATNPGSLFEARNSIPPGSWPLEIQFDDRGTLTRPSPVPTVPVPPDWFLNLTPEQVEAWERIQNPSSDPRPESADPHPPPRLDLASDPAGAQAVQFHQRLALLRTPSPSEPAESRGPALLTLATEAIRSRVQTASGLPLGAVALAEAQRQNPDAPLDAAQFAVLADLVLVQPSILTPWLLDEADHRVADADPEARSAVTRLRDLWVSADRRREIAARIPSEVATAPQSPKPIWVSASGQDWLAFVPGAEATRPAAQSGPTPDNARARRSFQVVPRQLLASIFRHAAEMDWGSNSGARPRPPGLPAGISLRINLEGRDLDLPGAAWAASNTNASLLASIAAELAPEPTFDPGEPRPRFTVDAVLTNPAALFAAHRQRQWIFGGLILATAGVAGIGVRQAQRAFQRQLELNREQSNFVSSVSHELRAPLASMRLLAEGLAEDRLTGEDKRREYARLIVRETRRLGTLVENVLDVARLDQGRTHYEFSPTDVRRLVEETAHLLEPVARERSVALEVRLPEAPAGDSESANWDGAAIQQALVNLIDNALKHSPEGTTVVVFLEAMPGHPRRLRIGVRDQGPGIPGDEQERIFERFHRRGSELRRETQGIGLGLTLVRHIAEGHHGTVRVESTPGHGATFLLELPENP